MGKLIGRQDTFSRWKPKGFEKYLTVSELCAVVGRSHSRIIQLERQGAIPSPIRQKVGRLRVRLYDPSQVKEIQKHFANAKPGPKKRPQK
jgi:hypothetical protein